MCPSQQSLTLMVPRIGTGDLELVHLFMDICYWITYSIKRSSSEALKKYLCD